MAENSVVREVLGRRNYKTWSNCMEVYLLSQDLWDVIEGEEEDESKSWTIKNALALHAIHMSCNATNLSAIDTLKSAKEAWHFLRGTNQPPLEDHDSDAKVIGYDSSDCSSEESFEEPLDAPLQYFHQEPSQDNFGQQHKRGKHMRDCSREGSPLQQYCHEEPSQDNFGQELEQSSTDKDVIGVEYAPFVQATKEENWGDMEGFLNSHPEAISAAVVDGRTALYYVLDIGNIEIGKLLVEKTLKVKDLEIQDDRQCTAFARLTNHNKAGVLDLLTYIVSKNKELPNIGNDYTVPVVMASWKGFKHMTRYLYGVTNKDILDPDKSNVGVKLLLNCINIRLFGIASDIVTAYPKILQHSFGEISPIHALAKCFSALENGKGHKKSRVFKLNHWRSKTRKCLERLLGEEDISDESDDEKFVYNQAQDFLRLVCAQVSKFDVSALTDYVYKAMIEASKNGVVEFVSEMLIANPILIKAEADQRPLFWHAIENRQEKIYSLLYSFVGEKDYILSYQNEEKNNILHLVAKLPPSVVLGRSSGSALQMQRELQWFQEVWSLAKLRYREDLNQEKLTPSALFTKAHAKLMEDGEKAMKDTAQSSTVVGALIVTVMFAAAFTVPGGNNGNTGLPMFLRNTLFRVFIVCDALSLYSSTTSVLVFLGILTSRYAEQDFVMKLPSKLMLGLATLFFSITTMMVSFCMALALMLDGQLQYILPTVLLACVPIIVFMSSVVPVMLEMFMSTSGPTIFDKRTTLREKIEAKKAKNKKPPVEGESEGARNNLLKGTSMTTAETDENKDKNVVYDPLSSYKV